MYLWTFTLVMILYFSRAHFINVCFVSYTGFTFIKALNVEHHSFSMSKYL